MRSLGLTLWHMVWVHVASGLICILVPLLIGSLAERKSSTPKRYLYKLCFSLSLMVAAFGYTALLAVPRVQRIPRQPLIDFDCSSPMNAVVNLEKCSNWETCSDVASAWSSTTFFRFVFLIFCTKIFLLKGSTQDISLIYCTRKLDRC